MLCCLVQAISASMSEGDVTATSCTVGFVGADSSFTILSDADLESHVAALKDAEDAPAGAICLACPGVLFYIFKECCLDSDVNIMWHICSGCWHRWGELVLSCFLLYAT